MKAIAFAVILLSAFPAFADTYTGIVSGVKHFAKGGIAVDMDGRYPDEKMTLYVSPRAAGMVGSLPAKAIR